MPDDVEMDHNFISRLKITESTEDIKIGLPATPHRACDEFIFINDDPRDDYEAEFLSEPCPYPQWNIDLATYYSEEIEEHYAFDAVIIHNYISPKGSSYAGLNYMDIILPPDDNCLDGDYDFDAVSYTHLRAHETVLDLVCRLLLEKKKKTRHISLVNNSY